MTIQTDGFVSEPLQSEFIQIQGSDGDSEIVPLPGLCWSDF